MDTTLQSIIEIALQQGIWAALYIYLFFRMLKENAERETQYQQMINHLSTNVVEGIADINDKLDDMARSVGSMFIPPIWSLVDRRQKGGSQEVQILLHDPKKRKRRFALSLFGDL